MSLFITSKNPCTALLNLIICCCILAPALIVTVIIKVWYFEQTHDDMPRAWDVLKTDEFWHFDALTWTLLIACILTIVLVIHVCTGCLFLIFDSIVWVTTCQWCCLAGRKVKQWRTNKKKVFVDLETLLESDDDDNDNSLENRHSRIQSSSLYPTDNDTISSV